MNDETKLRIMKVIIGFDGSECARAAIDDLPRAGLPDETQAIVLCAADLPVEIPFNDALPSTIPQGVIDAARGVANDARKRATETADTGAQAVALAFPQWKVTAEAAAGSPYWTLIQRADTWGADLIVVGSQGLSALGRLVLGSVSQTVISHAACSVRIGRCAAAPRTHESVRLIIGIDGSADSAVAVEALASRNWPAGTEVKVMVAVDLKMMANPMQLAPGGEGPKGVSRPMDFALRCAEEVVSELTARGLHAEPLVVEGDPKKLLVREAETWHADCVFVGAQGHNRRQRFLLGSVSSTVASRAQCSVEIVRQP